jgi:anthranilate synthase component 1
MSLAELSEQPGKVETLSIIGEYIADPLNTFETLCQQQTNCMLLESAEIDSKDNVKSLILVDAAMRLECHGQKVRCKALTENGASIIPILEAHCPSKAELHQNGNEIQLSFELPNAQLDEDNRLKAPYVFDALRSIIQNVQPIRQHDQALFLGGVLAYDLLASFEKLPTVEDSENSCPDFVFYLAETLLIIDHKEQKTEIIGSVFSGVNVGNNYFAISKRMEELNQQVNAEPASIAKHKITGITPETTVDKSDTDYIADVERLKENILAGDVFQVVPSRTFSLPCPDPYLAYAKLKQQNPSPYMFFLQDQDFCMFGASPESALKYTKDTNEVEVYPIAGTRPRGKNTDGSIDADLDSRIELDLRQDEKEKAEHLMLVDLARNDIARVAEPGTRSVKELLKVDRYSHVMHLVSRVVGQLKSDLDALHAYQACMNMGTLVGAPKVKAAELIRHTEGKRRGSYGGAIGYINGKGDMDTCIVIRSAFVRNDTAYVQAGAGVVFDSNPQAEADETRGKAQAVITAILSAHQNTAANTSYSATKEEV